MKYENNWKEKYCNSKFKGSMNWSLGYIGGNQKEKSNSLYSWGHYHVGIKNNPLEWKNTYCGLGSNENKEKYTGFNTKSPEFNKIYIQNWKYVYTSAQAY